MEIESCDYKEIARVALCQGLKRRLALNFPTTVASGQHFGLCW